MSIEEGTKEIGAVVLAKLMTDGLWEPKGYYEFWEGWSGRVLKFLESIDETKDQARNFSLSKPDRIYYVYQIEGQYLCLCVASESFPRKISVHFLKDVLKTYNARNKPGGVKLKKLLRQRIDYHVSHQDDLEKGENPMVVQRKYEEDEDEINLIHEVDNTSVSINRDSAGKSTSPFRNCCLIMVMIILLTCLLPCFMFYLFFLRGGADDDDGGGKDGDEEERPRIGGYEVLD